MVGMGLPTDPILRIASPPGRYVVTGDISVWPNTEMISAAGNVATMASSRVTVAGAAPQDRLRSDPVRRVTSGWAHRTCHCAGTRNRWVTPSDSITSSVPAASNGAVGMMTDVLPIISDGGMVPMPAMWKSGTLSRATWPPSCRREVRIAVMACMSRFRWVSMAPLGRPVVPEVYMISATSRSSIWTSGGAVVTASSNAS